LIGLKRKREAKKKKKSRRLIFLRARMIRLKRCETSTDPASSSSMLL